MKKIKKENLEIYYKYLSNDEIYYIFKTFSKISTLFLTKYH